MYNSGRIDASDHGRLNDSMSSIGTTSSIRRRASTNSIPGGAMDLYYGHFSLADFQDGKRFSADDHTTILRDTQTAMQNISSRLLLGGTSSRPTAAVQDSKKNVNKSNNESAAMDRVRLGVGLYRNFPLARQALQNSQNRQAALKKGGHKQMNHVRGTDGWWRTLLTIEDRALDNILGPWLVVCCNAILACLLVEVWDIQLPVEALEQWDTIYALVLKTSLAFLLVFRLNRCAMRFWEARGYWGNMNHQTRNLVGTLLMYGTHSPNNRDAAIQWGSALCISAKNFIRSERHYEPNELAGFLTRHQTKRLSEANHGPLYAASMCRHYIEKIFRVDADTPPGLAHAYTVRMQECESYVAGMIESVSGMEKIRSTPLPIAYVAHLRIFLIAYTFILPYVWVNEWSWATIPLTAVTAFALLGIEGASSEVEIPFSKNRTNHLALDAYCLVILESVTCLVVQDANLHVQGRKGKGSVDKFKMFRATEEIDEASYESSSSEEEDDDDDNEIKV
ncbi:unnamed protein product [Pseudo-nitzschia multistriata]|uniref:Bestrophin homolog n=1 Tax=Pseudo-nitzschia multistriata TaxID=183589 RepID=A0A448YWF3_9STRA|nr:unnamed protein product [Pseudo-nitzschia multistriata]